jgi:adenine/guanine phosphoribosyltransferase-like PRPP-binding protein
MSLYYDNYKPSDLSEMVDRAVNTLLPMCGEFDSIAVRGVSGLMVGSPVALRLGKPLAVARKESEVAHASGVCNADLAGRRYIIIDDFVSSGATVNAITDLMTAETRACRVGLYMYNLGEYTPESQIQERYGNGYTRIR